MLIDTGADATALPRAYVEQLGVEPVKDKVYEAEGFDGQSRLVNMVEAVLPTVLASPADSGQAARHCRPDNRGRSPADQNRNTPKPAPRSRP